MESHATVFIGIDVSKDELVVAYRLEGKWIKQKIVNTVASILTWLKSIEVADKYFVLEATGPYSERLTHALASLNARFSIINPVQSRSMSKVLLKSNKTDDQDAQTLSILGEKLDLKAYKVPSAAEKSRKEAFSALVSLQKIEGQIKNQIHAFEYRVDPNPKALQALKDTLSAIQESIRVLEEELKPQQDEKEEAEIIQRIVSIKSVGMTTATAFVTLFGDFRHFENAKAFAQFIGVSPTEYSSGTSVRGRRGITKRGSAKIRALLFNCARSAIRFNPGCKDLYERLLKKDKNGKVALTAVMHKLARTIFGVVKSGINYNPDFYLQKIK